MSTAVTIFAIIAVVAILLSLFAMVSASHARLRLEDVEKYHEKTWEELIKQISWAAVGQKDAEGRLAYLESKDTDLQRATQFEQKASEIREQVKAVLAQAAKDLH